jgi:hypothetical protein
MFINELAEPTLLVIYPGRFQPFHKGHHAVYEYLTGKFGRNNVFIATSNKVDGDRSPFSFADKAYFMQLTGVPADRIVQAPNPYQIQSILDNSNIQVNPQNTVVIFAVSQKDMDEDPRFNFKPKKDGSTPYFQPLRNIKDTKSMQEHGYIMTVPTFDFTVAGAPMRSGTELRQLYADADEQQRQLIVKDLFGRYTVEAEKLMTDKIAPQAPKEVTRPNKLPKTVKPAGGLVKECAGVGVVKGGNDPRYVMATMGAQNDVNSGTLNKMMQGYSLVGRKSPGGKTKQNPVKGGVGKGTK